MSGEIHSIENLQKRLSDFSAERDWGQFHGPRNLLLALTGEVGELCSLVQWVPDSEVHTWSRVPQNQSALKDELADVLLYLLQLSDALEVDLYDAAIQKIERNAVRYSVQESKGSARKRPQIKKGSES